MIVVSRPDFLWMGVNPVFPFSPLFWALDILDLVGGREFVPKTKPQGQFRLASPGHIH